MKSFYAEIPYLGDIEAIHSFYGALGIETTETGIRLPNFEMIFADEKTLGGGRTLSIETEENLDDVVARLDEIGVSLLGTGFDVSGPFIVVADPAGQKVRVGLSGDAYSRSMRADKSSANDA